MFVVVFLLSFLVLVYYQFLTYICQNHNPIEQEKKVEDIIYDSSVPENSKNSPKGKDHSTVATKTKNENGENKKAPGKPSKKRKTTKKVKTEQERGAKKKKNDVKKKTSSPTSKCDEKKKSPKKSDACAGMKNIMAQFVKRSPVKSATSSSKDPDPSSSSQ